jgi:hypothetical protein
VNQWFIKLKLLPVSPRPMKADVDRTWLTVALGPRQK